MLKKNLHFVMGVKLLTIFTLCFKIHGKLEIKMVGLTSELCKQERLFMVFYIMLSLQIMFNAYTLCIHFELGTRLGMVW